MEGFILLSWQNGIMTILDQLSQLYTHLTYRLLEVL